MFQAQLGRPTLTYFTCLAARKMDFMIFILPNMQQVLKCYVMISQAGFQSSDEILLKLNCLLIPLIRQWKIVLSIAKWNSLNCKRTWTPRGDILRKFWWTFINSIFAESFPICPVTQEKYLPLW